MRRMTIWKVQRKELSVCVLVWAARFHGAFTGEAKCRGSSGTKRRFLILCFPAWWVLAPGFWFCRGDRKKHWLVRWSGDSGASRESQAARNQSLLVVCFGGNTEDVTEELTARMSAATSFGSLSRGQISVCCSLWEPSQVTTQWLQAITN